MVAPLPQQRLLLELLVMSGDIAVQELSKDSILWRTIDECKAAGWLTAKTISSGFHTVSITGGGRLVIGQFGRKTR
ncbi:MAG: hypothetical protein O7D31_12090 [Alphaproteobacteria bacterium]|nr:hypothetical protein [Alphaproteobacteria bacterium]